jgi:hypothetical protein
VEYDVVHAFRSATDTPAQDDDAEVSGYIIIVGGSPWTAQTVASPLLLSVTAPALYSAPRLGAIALGVNPEG